MEKSFRTVITLLVGVMVVATIIFGGACAKPAPSPAPAPAPVPAPTPAPAPAPSPAPKPEWKPPSVINIGTGSVTSVGFTSGQPFGDVISSKTGTLIRYTPMGKSFDAYELLRSKGSQFLGTPALEIHDYSRGVREADRDGWGPQKLRVVWLNGPTPMGEAIHANSGIKTGADLKGKKIATFPTYPTGQVYTDGILAFFNIKKGDYTEVPVESAPAGYSAWHEGKVDATWAAQESGAAIEMAASRWGLYWLPLPPDAKEGWMRLKEACPIAYPIKATSGPGSPVDTWGYDYHTVTYDWQDEQLVYWLTKVKSTYFSSYKDAHPTLQRWTLDNALNTNAAIAPYHPGAVRYYKEIGVWTKDHDTWQAKMLAEEEQRISAWKAKHPDWKWGTGS